MPAVTYLKVFDERKRRVRGLWRRAGWFYARLACVDELTGRKITRRVRLETARTVPEARIAMHDLQKDRRDENLPILKRSPLLADYWGEYFIYYNSVKDAKRASTLRREQSAKKSWLAHLGDLRLNEIKRAHLNGYLAKRRAAGVSPRSVNREMIALRNVLKRALEDGWLKSLPMDQLKPLKVDQVERKLVAAAALDALFTAAAALPKSGELLADVLRLLTTSGARIAETLRLRWSDVDFAKRQLTLGADGLAKNRQHRVVDFNAALEAHLQSLKLRRQGVSQWLFPSPRRGEKDVPIVNFNKALRLACQQAKLPDFGFHDCRHYFISQCVMCGIDYLTIAKWVGHQDGGVLIGKVYGHINNEHARRQAEKLILQPSESLMASTPT